jgi:hypothetical protein
LEDPNVLIWDLAKWRHGRRACTLPPIQDSDGLTMEGPQMAAVFHTRFFPKNCAVPTLDPDFPLPAFPLHSCFTFAK